MISIEDVQAARKDPEVFAEMLVGAPLWDYQLEVARSPARYRVICAGRQVGKSRLLAILALHQAFTVPKSTVLLISAGDTASKRLLEQIGHLALAAPLLAGSVVDESSKRVVLDNGSQILSVPSSENQIRGWSVDLLIVDEAATVPDEIWRAAEPTIIARPGSRVLLCSSPAGGADHFFRTRWRIGMDAPDEQLASWHWPSSMSPLVDEVYLEQMRKTVNPFDFIQEYLAEWLEDAGAYFTEAELSNAVADYELEPPEAAHERVGGWVVGGVDWGFTRDANALTVVASRGLDDEGRTRFWIPWVEGDARVPYAEWIDRVVQTSTLAGGGFRYSVLVCETNGVGMMPSQELDARLSALGGYGLVSPVTTSVRSKEDAFGFIKLLLQRGRLELPNHPELLRQLRNLQFEALPSGGMRIAVPERLGHDDLAMSFAMAMSSLMAGEFAPIEPDRIIGMEEMDELLGYDEEDSWPISPY